MAGVAPYDTLNTVLNEARVRLGDKIKTLEAVSGKLLDRSQPFTLVCVNGAWRKMQEFLDNLGHSRTVAEAVIEGLPVVADSDPSSRCWIDWVGFNDSSTTSGGYFLPTNLLVPKKVWERQSGMNGVFLPMDLAIDGIADSPKRTRNMLWEWRGDKIWLQGSIQVMDLKVRYEGFLPDFADFLGPVSIPWFEAVVPIARCLDAFANYICAEALRTPDPQSSMLFKTDGEAAARLICNRDTRMKQRVNLRRLPRSAGARGDYMDFT